jgi:alcohol dehydrogenase
LTESTELEELVVKALVYRGPGQISWDDVPNPVIQHPTDVIVKMKATTICGTDLHILKGDVPEVEAGRILGHEGIGVITEVGAGVTQLKVGDEVILACISACGACSNCHQALYSHCLNAEGAFGDRLDPRPPDRRHSGRIRPSPLRGELGLQGSRGRQ